MSSSKSTRMAFRLSLPSLLALLAVCSDGGRRVVGVEETPPQVIVSDPSPKVSLASAIDDAVREGSAASLVATPAVSAAEEGIAYIALPPRTVQDGVTATIRNRDTGSAVATLVVDGGFDPVPVEARADDTLELVVIGSSGATLYSAATRVPARRAPRVVRTVPPRGKTDVPLNARIIVVFSEPIDPGTLTAMSVRLLRGADPVAGQLEFVDANRLIAALIPETSLIPATGYQLVVSQAIRDRDGESLEAPVTIDFTTCANDVDPSGCPPFPASGDGVVSGVVTAQSPLRTCGRPGLNARHAPTVLVTNRSGTRLANVPVRFVVGPESGEISDPVVMTDGSGVARAGTWRLGDTPGENTLTASVAGSLPVTFTAVVVTRWNVVATYDLETVGGRSLPLTYSGGGRSWTITGGHYVLADDGTYAFGYEVDDAKWTSADIPCSMAQYIVVDDSTLRFYLAPGSYPASFFYQERGGLFSTAARSGNRMTVKYVDFIDFEDEVYVLSTAPNSMRVRAP